MIWDFLELFEASWCLRNSSKRFLGVIGTSTKSENPENDRLEGFSQNEIEKSLIQDEAE